MPSLGRCCVQTSFYHVGKITMDFFLGVQLHFTIDHLSSVRKSGHGLLPANSIWQGAGSPATSQMRCWLLRRHKLHILRFRAERESSSIPLRLLSKSQSRCWIAILFFARRRNVGFSCCAAHTPAVGAESRTQRRHAPHGGERCPLWKGARMQTVQGVTLLPSCSGKRQSH